jgi:hypothetical protein
VALLGRSNLPPVAEIAEPELRLGGYRINPRNNGPANSRLSWLNACRSRTSHPKQIRNVPLPAGHALRGAELVARRQPLAFLRGVENGLELWVAERGLRAGPPRHRPTVNAAFGTGSNGCPTAARCWCA